MADSKNKKRGSGKWLAPRMPPVQEEARWESGEDPGPDMIRKWLIEAMQAGPDELETCLQEIHDHGWRTDPVLLRACQKCISNMRDKEKAE